MFKYLIIEISYDKHKHWQFIFITGPAQTFYMEFDMPENTIAVLVDYYI